MKFANQAVIVLASVMFIGACGTEQTVTKKQVRNDWRGKTVPFTVGKDKDGNPMMKSDRRSSFEGRGSNIAGGKDFGGKRYSAETYRKKSWFGSKLFGKKEYGGNIDASKYQREPWYVKKQARASGKSAGADGKSYGVNPFRTSTAREQGGRRLRNTSDAETAVRRRVFKQPDVSHWKEQQGLSIKDTNRMLGR